MEGFNMLIPIFFKLMENARIFYNSLLYNALMKLVDKKITRSELKKMSSRMFGGLVKAVVDIKKNIMVVDGAMHADEEKYLLDIGSSQDDLWGINFYPELNGDDFIEFDSIINIRPKINNFSRDIKDKSIRETIVKIIDQLVEK